MFPDLSYLLHYLFGTEPDNGFSVIKTFGLFLAFAFIASAWLLGKELKRREELGLIFPIQVQNKQGMSVAEHLFNLAIGFILGFKGVYIITHWSEFSSDTAAVLLSAKGSLAAGLISMLLYAGYFYWRERNRPKGEAAKTWSTVHPYEKVGDITIVAAISGVIGAKIFAIFESVENIRNFMEAPMEQLLSGSGLAIYGGLIVAFVVVLLYVRKLGIPPWQMIDAGAPAMMMGYAVGRLGCQFSGDGDWGIEHTAPNPGWIPDWLWAYSYPHNVINAGQTMVDCTWRHCSELVPPVYPTPIYESILAFIITGILWSLRKKLSIPGQIFFLYMLLNGIERFFIEKIRVNDKLNLFGIEESQATFLAVGFALTGIIGLIYVQRKNNPKPTI